MTARDKERYIEKWRQVIRVMEEVAAAPSRTDNPASKRFNIDVWYLHKGCGTVACVLGWCGLDPWFQRRGLRTGEEGTILRVARLQLHDFQAITAFFDPDLPQPSPEPFEVTRIFHNSDTYENRFGRETVKPEHVIALIREYVKTTFDVEI